MKNIVIIGLGAASTAAILAIRKIDRTSNITVIDKKDFDLLHTCGLPFLLSDTIKDEAELKHDLKLSMMKVNQIQGNVTTIDTKGKKVILEDNKEVNYDTLLIDTGSSCFIPPIEGIEKCDTVDCIEHVKELSKRAGSAKKAVIIGAGAIGLETAIALKHLKLDVTVIEMMSSVLPNSIDKEISTILEDFLKEKGINLLLGKKLEKEEDNCVIVSGENIKTDIVVMAVGVRANTVLAKDAGIKTDKGIIVDEHMQTSNKDIYAIGDCVQVKNLITKKDTMSQLASSAYRQGTVAGSNMAGKELDYHGALNTFVTMLDDIEIAATGLTTKSAEADGIEVVSMKSKSKTKPEWFPGGKDITLKIIADKKTKKVIGAQGIGSEVAARINIISTAIKAGFKVSDLTDIELAYCPAVSQTYDIITQTADFLLRKLR